MARAWAAVLLAACLLVAADVSADHGGLTYEGHHGNAVVAGCATDGRLVAVMGGLLNRALVRLRDAAGRTLIALSETIKEDRSGQRASGRRAGT